MQILAISGSLRSASSNTTLLRAASRLAPTTVAITLYQGLGDLPHFNPDLDGEGVSPPPAVADLRHQLQAADGILICSPEYAHGVPGTLKNALDWIVSSGEFMGKPVALLNASRHATYAQAALTETLTVMMAPIVTEASIIIPIQGKAWDEETILADTAISALLGTALAAFIQAIHHQQNLHGDLPDDNQSN